MLPNFHCQSSRKSAVKQAGLVIVIVLSLLALMGCDTTATREKSQTVEISSAQALDEYFDTIGYNVIANPDILKTIPRIRFTHIPDNWQPENSIPLKKSVFFRAMASAILQVNETILANHQRIQKLDRDHLSDDDREWLAGMMQKYKVTDKQTDFTADEMMKLKRRVDIIPPSLALVQAAIESGWGSSRFAREGNALFGQWTTGEGLKAQGSDARLAAFATPTKSVAAYCLNLNTHRSYTQFRHARAEMRQKGTTIDGVNLAGYLDRYSEKGEAYTRLIKDMIQRDGLEIADTAQLSKGPDIIIRPVGP